MPTANLLNLKHAFCALLTWSLVQTASAAEPPSLAEFGHGLIRVAGHETLGFRPLIVIIAEFQDAPLAHPVSWYDDYLLNLFPTNSTGHSVNAAFREMSNNRFFWSRGQTVRLPLEPSHHYANFPNELLFHSNLVWQALSLRLFDLGSYDTDGNHIVTPGELQIMVLKNEGVSNGAARSTGRVHDPHSSYSWGSEGESTIALFEHQTDFATIVHEATHTVGTIDLYSPGCRSERWTLMSCTLCNPPASCPERPDIWHLDPLHKMQLGWSDPRIYSLRRGGTVSLPAAQLRAVDAPVILYDPDYNPITGGREFFMLEYRARNPSVGGGYDANVGGDGLVIWHVQLGQSLHPIIIDGGPAVWSELAPDLGRGVGGVWGSGSTTPYLTWNNGIRTATRLHVRPFSARADTITVEWWAEDETWVNFNWPGLPGFPEDGTPMYPFNSIGEAVTAASYGGRIRIYQGTSAETATINKRLTLETLNGPVIIGGRP